MDDLNLQTLFRSVVLQASDVVLVTEAEPVDRASGGPRVVYVNPAFTRMTGYTSEEIVGRTPRLLQSPRTDRTQLAKIRAALGKWEPVEVELLNVRKDGSEFWVQISITPAADERGWFTHWIAIQRDITERKQRDLVVQAMLKSSSDLMLLLDEQGVVTAAAPSCHQILGIEVSEVIGSAVTDLVHPLDRASMEPVLSAAWAVRFAEGASAEVRVRTSDGRWLWMQLNAVDLPQSSDAVLLLAGVDISDRRRSADTMRELNEKFRSAFVDAPIGMSLTDTTGRLLQVNVALASMLGRPAHELTGMTIQDLHPPDTYPAGGSHPHRMLTNAHAGRDRQETRLLHADGSVIEVLHSSSVVVGEHLSAAYLVDHFEDITERKTFEDLLRHQALHDPLTGLANRALLNDRIDQALLFGDTNGHEVGVLFIDLDRFKVVNDSVGHEAGDTVLAAVADRLRMMVRPGDTVARFGGDEFVVLCPQISTDQATVVANRIQSGLGVPLVHDGVQFEMTASIGVAVSGQGTSTAATLLRDADTAMYEAKTLGRRRVEVFNEVMSVRLRARMRLEADLRHAIPSGELRLHFQPIMKLDGREVVGLEALVRWLHPERGLLAPGDFIAFAEEVGLIQELGSWVLQEAARAAARAHQLTPSAPVVWVNVSTQQLQDPEFVISVERLLIKNHLPGQALGIEITESVIAADLIRTRDVLSGLRALGLSVAIDDFGTGYSSLSYLAHLPVDAVKIDRSFVAGLSHEDTRRESCAIINAVVGLARALDLDVIAEGIETQAALEEVQALGCGFGQGFLLGRPAPERLPDAVPT